MSQTTLTEKGQTLYGLPGVVRFGRRCVMSIQRPSSYPEFRHRRDRVTLTLAIDDQGVCDACRYADRKREFDWALYTDYGWQNFRNWIEVGRVHNLTFKPNGRAHRLLSRLAVETCCIPSRPSSSDSRTWRRRSPSSTASS